MTDEEVEPPVIVIIEPDGTGCPSRSRQPRFLGYVGESAITIVVIQDTPAILRKVQVRKPIAIVVANRHPLTKAASSDSGCLSDIGEGAVTAIAI